MDVHGMPLESLSQEGTRADCKEAAGLVNGILAEALLADCDYDTNALIEQVL